MEIRQKLKQHKLGQQDDGGRHDDMEGSYNIDSEAFLLCYFSVDTECEYDQEEDWRVSIYSTYIGQRESLYGQDIQLTPEEDLPDFALGPLAFYNYDIY